MNRRTLKAVTASRPPWRSGRHFGEHGFVRSTVVAALVAVLVAAGIVVWLSRRGEAPSRLETAAGPQPDPAAAPPQAAPPSAQLSEATLRGASADPTFQKAEIATDPSFLEARGRMLPGVPDFPSHPAATLVGSAEQNRAGAPTEGYRIKWTTRESVPAVMAWYQKTLPSLGWTYTPPDDGAPEVEQVARISKGDLKGYIAAEATGDGTEIVASLKKSSR